MRRLLSSIGVALLLSLMAVAPATADTSDFSYDSWHVEYDISMDDEGGAIATVTETLIARFPEIDQNRGIVRGLPISYEGSSTDPRDFSVTDETGSPIPFWTEEEDGFIAVLTGTDQFVHGEQTYVIRYTLSDVILARDDGSADEFYWDLVDHEHLQPIGEASAEIRFSGDMVPALNGNVQCYVGPAGSERTCDASLLSSEGTVEIEPMPLERREGMTIAVGMAPGTVTQPPTRAHGVFFDIIPAAAGIAAAIAGIAGIAAVELLKRKRRMYRGTVIAQYEVPDHLPPLIAAPVAGRPAEATPAQIVHLAVRGAIRIEDSDEATDTFGAASPRPRLRLMDPARVHDPLDQEALGTLFPSGAPGEVCEIPKQSTSFTRRMEKLRKGGAKAARSRGYQVKEASTVARVSAITAIALIAVSVIVGFMGIDRGREVVQIVAFSTAAIGLIGVVWSLPSHLVHTPLGAETREHLAGVRLFIRVAEAERLRMLQSYSGAERRPDGSINVVELYERLLPYAVIFGEVKEWGRVLDSAYRTQGVTAPLWYPALGHRGVEYIGGSIASFTSTLSSSTSYTSSSSGGSTGGGFSGGGGGGGFSGGR